MVIEFTEIIGEKEIKTEDRRPMTEGNCHGGAKALGFTKNFVKLCGFVAKKLVSPLPKNPLYLL